MRFKNPGFISNFLASINPHLILLTFSSKMCYNIVKERAFLTNVSPFVDMRLFFREVS